MTSRHAIHAPGLCDASAAVAWHQPQRARWRLSPQYRMQRRIALMLVTYLAGVLSALALIGA